MRRSGVADIPADETAADAHIDPAQLEGMSKDELKKLAEDMGVELPRGAAKALIIDRLTAVAVQIPAENEEGAQ